MPPSAKDKFKESLLNALPRPLARALYYRRHKPLQLTTQALPQVHMPMVIDGQNKLWRTRLNTDMGHEVGLCRWLQQHTQPNEVFYDVGSCYGFFPALINELQPSAKVHAFEANWMMFDFLEQNASLPGRQWQLVSGFIGNGQEETISLDAYTKEQTAVPTLVKIDVDGFETQVLQGASLLLANGQTHWLIEIHPQKLQEYGSSTEECLALLQQHDLWLLPQLREDNEEWTQDLGQLSPTDNPYIYAAPKGKSRMG